MVASTCKTLLDAGITVSGLHQIDPLGSGGSNPITVYCDMTGAGGGWTLIRNVSANADIGTNNSVEGMPQPNVTDTHLSPTSMRAIAALSRQVQIRTAGQPDDSIVSNLDSDPIVNLRAGNPMVPGRPNCDSSAVGYFTGNALGHTGLQWSCCPEVGNYPNGVFHACNFADGLTWIATNHGWTYFGGGGMEVYFR